ncbi:MAG TPA: patatin-like phospholipase family protein [Dehalococcoidia bacterium]|nr:patatin-like phospholipase family protein [Dehalococcoidia bacterium]
MKQALVLGGGGAIGIAWETGVLAGLLDAGVDVSAAGLIVGTSAGSVVGTSLAHGRDPREWQVRPPRRPQGEEGPPAPHASAIELFQVWSAAEIPNAEDAARVGALALQTPPVLGEQDWLASFQEYGWPGWPAQPLLICAVDCESGELRAFAQRDGVDIVRAVAASCAVPGIFPPVEIAGRRYMDGAGRSWTSADLTIVIEPDVVLTVAPAGNPAAQGLRRNAALQVEREHRLLEEAGAKTMLVTLDEASAALAANLMDQANAPRVFETGREQGRRIASEVGSFWNGSVS